MRYQFGSFTLDTDARELSRHGELVHLSGKALDLLRLLVEQRPRAMTKAQLHDSLWPDTFVADSSLPVLVREVRAALGDWRDSIRTVHRYGYAFSAKADEHRVAMSIRSPGPLHQLIHAEKIFLLAQGRNIIGRDPGADVFIPSTSVSRHHAVITTEADTAAVEDLTSKNGTFLDGVAITGAAPLGSGSVLRVGAIELRYVCVFPNSETETLGR